VKESREGWVPPNVREAEKLLRQLFGDGSETNQDTIPRPINTTPLFPLKQIWPEVVERLAALLAQTGEAALAEAVHELDVFDRCRSGADYCATVHTQPRSAERYGPSHRCVVFWSRDTICVDTGLPASSGGRPTAPHITILDVVDEEIVCIEILDDAESRSRLLTVLPDES